MLRRQRDFRAAAEYVAEALARLPVVRKIVLFGSVVAPLKKEVPRFREYRRAEIEVWHECWDADLAVWTSDLASLRSLQQARSQALNDLLTEKSIGVAHHQVEIFLMSPAQTATSDGCVVSVPALKASRNALFRDADR